MATMICAAIICSNLTTHMLGIGDIITEEKLDFMYEHMESVGSLDVVSLPTTSADTKMIFSMGARNMCYSCFLVGVYFPQTLPAKRPTEHKLVFYS